MSEEAPEPDEIGRAGWTILHTTAAAYPDNPSPAQQRRMWDFLNAWSHVYPCTHCATHMRIDLRKHPPEVESKESLSVWTCRLHNKVNKVLGKDEFPCDIDSILKRWHPLYPNVGDQHQNGGFNDLPPYGGGGAAVQQQMQQQQQQQPSSSSWSIGRIFGFGSSTPSKPPPQQQPQHQPAGNIDPDLQSLMDMQCSAFCPKNEKNEYAAA